MQQQTIRNGVTNSIAPCTSTSPSTCLMLGSDSCFEPQKKSESEEQMGLNTLPYDLLLNIAAYLDVHDVHALHLVSLSFGCMAAVWDGVGGDCSRVRIHGSDIHTWMSTRQHWHIPKDSSCQIIRGSSAAHGWRVTASTHHRAPA